MKLKLKAREKRIKHVKEFFKLNPNDSLIIIKSNMPSSLTNKPINYYLNAIFLNFLTYQVEFEVFKKYESHDGPYIFLKIKDKNIELKRTLINIESSHPLGRLIDLDYYLESNKSVYRSDLYYPQRKCLLCDKDVFICMREGNHTPLELENKIHSLFIDFIKEYVFDLADFSIVRELGIEDKFGLVTFTNQGNHKDMDFNIMINAKDAILPYFPTLVEMSYNSNNLENLLKNSRAIGIEAENAMFEKTNGINAYKGIIFLLGIVSLSLGYSLKNNYSFEDIFTNIKTLSKDIYDDFDKYDDTFTTSLYKDLNISGIRGVVKGGLQIVYNHLNDISPISEDDELRALLYKYILESDDTIFIKRSNSYDNYLAHKKYLKTLDPLNKSDLQTINKYTNQHYLSFGGSADLLIVSIFLSHIKQLYIK